MNLKDLLDVVSAPGADWVGLREVWEHATTRYCRDGKSSKNSSEESTGLMVEVLKNGCITYTATADRSKSGVQQAVDQAIDLAERSSKYRIHEFTVSERPASEGKYRSPRNVALGSHSPKDINDFLVNACGKLKVSEKIHRTTGLIYLVESKQNYVSTNGANFEQDFSLLSYGFKATAVDGTSVQSRSDGGFLANSLQGGMEIFNQDKIENMLSTIGEQAVELLSAEECPTGTMDLVVMPDQMMLQIHESIGHPLEIDRILGDERNYAGSSFVQRKDFGSLTYGSPIMNVSFDPTVENEYASYSFDDNGTPATKEYLIKEGKLLRGLGGLESQTRSGLKGVANARASLWNRPPIDRMANINLEPGDSNYDEIISAVENGVLMESNNSWSIDDYRRKFQFGCEYGKRIKNGKITNTICNPNYRGITIPFWTNLKMLGNASTRKTYGTPYCGKGEPNQAIRVGHASPVCLFTNIEIFGGSK